MAEPWHTLATVATADGPLELRRRGAADFLIVIAGRVLMTSGARRSEEALAKLACERVTRSSPRVLIGGLGMGYTLRAALDALPANARVTVAELTPQVVEWCRGPLATLTNSAVLDPRVRIEVGDVARIIEKSKAGEWDAIILDLYEGPHEATQKVEDPFYGPKALARTGAALRENGVFAVWSEEPDAAFARRFESAGFQVSTHRAGRGGRSHVIYLGAREAEKKGSGRR